MMDFCAYVILALVLQEQFTLIAYHIYAIHYSPFTDHASLSTRISFIDHSGDRCCLCHPSTHFSSSSRLRPFILAVVVYVGIVSFACVFLETYRLRYYNSKKHNFLIIQNWQKMFLTIKITRFFFPSQSPCNWKICVKFDMFYVSLSIQPNYCVNLIQDESNTNM